MFHWQADGALLLNVYQISSKIFLLTVPRRCLFCGSFMLFLWKGWPLGSCLWYIIVGLLPSHLYPGSGVVLDCIDSWSLPSFLLSMHSQIVPLWLIVAKIQDLSLLWYIVLQILSNDSWMNFSLLFHCLPFYQVFYHHHHHHHYHHHHHCFMSPSDK